MPDIEVQKAVKFEPLTPTVTSLVLAFPVTPPKSEVKVIFDQPGNMPVKLVNEWLNHTGWQTSTKLLVGVVLMLAYEQTPVPPPPPVTHPAPAPK